MTMTVSSPLSMCPNRTTVGLKRKEETMKTAGEKRPNRTTVGLKPLWVTPIDVDVARPNRTTVGLKLGLS